MTRAPFARAPEPSPADRAGLSTTIADYYLGWYDGDPQRMARALHRDLAKRGWLADASGTLFLGLDTFDSMVDSTRKGKGKRSEPEARAYDITSIEVYGDIASACVHAVPYVDYLHLVRTPDGWRILNALWCRP